MSIVAFLALGLLPSFPTAQDKGKLKEFEKPFKDDSGDSRGRSRGGQADSPRRGQEESPTQRDWDEEDSDSSFWGEICSCIAECVVETVCGPVVTYPFKDHGLRFDDFPYATEPERYLLDLEESDKCFSLETRAYAVWVDDDIWGWGAAGDFRLNTNLGLRVDFSQYREDVADRTDTLEIQEYEFNVSFGDGARDINFSLGFGVGSLSGDDTHWGLSFQSALEAYIAKPFSLRAHAAALLLEGADLYDLSIEGRVHWDRAAFFLGVRSLINSDGDDITGPMIGVAVWF